MCLENCAGRPSVVQLLNYKKNGDPFINYLSITPIHDSKGHVTHFVGIQSDISDLVNHKKAELAAKSEAAQVITCQSGQSHDSDLLLFCFFESTLLIILHCGSSMRLYSLYARSYCAGQGQCTMRLHVESLIWFVQHQQRMHSLSSFQSVL